MVGRAFHTYAGLRQRRRLPMTNNAMIRQAQSYLAGAASSAALIGAAVATFVLLASFSAFREWPLPDFNGAEVSESVNAPLAVSSPASQAAAAALGSATDFITSSAPAGAAVVAGPEGTTPIGEGPGAPGPDTTDPGGPTGSAPVVRIDPSTPVVNGNGGGEGANPTPVQPPVEPGQDAGPLGQSVNNLGNSLDSTVPGLGDTVRNLGNSAAGHGTLVGDAVSNTQNLLGGR